MTELNLIKNKITRLYETNPDIHMNISISAPKISLTNAKATIIEVYPNLFRIKESSTGIDRTHIIPYTDILTKHIQISELNN